MKKIGRTHYLVLPSYQLRLLGFLIFVVLIGSLVHGFFLYRITARTIEDGFFSAHNRLRSTWEILKPAIIVTNGIFFLFVSLAFLLIIIFLSHRLIGPMIKIAGRLRELAAGRFDLAPVRLRKGDEGHVISDAINMLQANIQVRMTPLAALKERLDRGETIPPDEMKIALEQALSNLCLPS